MKGINTLIRLSKRTLDELRKQQAVLEAQREKLLEAVRKLKQEMEREMSLSAKAPEMATFYGQFAKHIRARQDDIRGEIAKVDAQIEQMADKIAEAFADLKKYEIARDNAKARQKAEEARKETIMMDDIAGVRFIRQQKDSEDRNS